MHEQTKCPASFLQRWNVLRSKHSASPGMLFYFEFEREMPLEQLFINFGEERGSEG